MIVNVLELDTDDKQYFFQLADGDLAYQTLRLLAKADSSKEVSLVPTKISYEELVLKADMASAVFALGYIRDSDISVDLQQALDALMEQMKGLQHIAELHTEKRAELEGFLAQYLPETIRLLLAYQQYKLLADEKETAVYDKILELVDGFSDAVNRKTYTVRNDQALDIIAGASALALTMESGTRAEETEMLPFTYEELAEQADINACIVAFEYISSYKLPVELSDKIKDVIGKLRGMKKTIELYPDKINEISRFLSYYIPEAVRVVVSYNSYQRTGLDEETMDKVYLRVVGSLDMLEDALEKKTKDIYRVATMHTVAQADALKTILGQDGFTKGDQRLKH